MPPRPDPQQGFTLTELLITLAIAGILAMLGAPAMGHLLFRVQATDAESAIVASLHHARTAAVMRNTRVVVCPSRDGQRCHPGDAWQHGWMIAADADRDGQPDAGVPVIGRHAAVPDGTRMLTSSGRARIIFHPDGNAAGSNARFTICHLHVDHGRSVVLANTGRVRLADADPAHLQACLADTR